MTDENRPRTDEEFVNSENIKFQSPYEWGLGAVVYVYEPDEDGKTVNVEFMRDDDSGDMVDAYFYPEDLERLGIMFQYLGKTAREARDGNS